MSDEQFLVENYPSEGADYCAEHLKKPISSIRNKANALHLKVNKTRLQKQYESVKDWMSNNNPMHNPDVVQKVQAYYDKHPDKRGEILRRLNEGKARLSRQKPSKPELLLGNILDAFGIKHDAQYIIKDKFVVDFKIGNLIIQVDGEYWHGHPRFYPLTERQSAQQKRDKAQDKYLTACGYTVVRVWERNVTNETIEQILVSHRLL